MVKKGLTSILIPANKEKFLTQTINDLLKKCTNNIEIIVVLDGYWPSDLDEQWQQQIVNDSRVHYIHFSQRKGMRAGINAAAALAQGEYLLKLDGHCMVDIDFDAILKMYFIKDDWVMIPRRYRLDAKNWKLTDLEKPPIDYEYLNWPKSNPQEVGLHGNVWNERTRERMNNPAYMIDDNMSFQGSCWFMKRIHFERLGGLSEVGYETFVQEAQEIGLKTWLGGGRVVTNKYTWYAHLHKGKELGRGYFIDKGEMIRGRDYSVDFWMNNRWGDRVHDIAWLIEQFWKVPSWPEDRKLWKL